MPGRLSAPILAAVLCSQCGASPTQPTLPLVFPAITSSPLNLQTGIYRVTVMGADFDGFTAASGAVCAPVGVPPAGKMVESELFVGRDGDEWLAISPTSANHFVMRIRDGGHRQGTTRNVVGTATGRLWDQGGRAVIVTLGDAAGATTLAGETGGSLPTVFAELTGTVSFSDAQGRTSTCSRVSITFAPR